MLQVGSDEYPATYAQWQKKHDGPRWGELGYRALTLDVAVAVALNYSREWASSEDGSAYAVAMDALREATELGLAPMPNVPALRKTTDWVQEQDRLIQLGEAGNVFWNQGTWRSVQVLSNRYAWSEEQHDYLVLGVNAKDCKTGMCFAGHAADTAGVKWNDPGKGDSSVVLLTPEVRALFPFTEFYVDTSAEIPTIPVSEFATGYLGLTEREAGALFSGDNKAIDITRIVGVILDRAGERL